MDGRLIRSMSSICLMAAVIIRAAALQPPVSAGASSADWGTCKAHPAKVSGSGVVVPVLVKEWNFKQRDPSRYQFQPSVYLPRLTESYYSPVDEQAPDKYKGFDFFHYIWVSEAGVEADTVEMKLNRPGHVCLLLPAFKPFTKPTLTGYRSEGLARLVGSPTVKYGYYKDRSLELRGSVYLFCRNVATNFNLPSAKWVGANLKGLPHSEARYMVLLAETDGKPSAEPVAPGGMTIVPGAPCPKELHDTWVAASDDPNDTEIADMTFPTWHPLWDPCYWCTYGHEHGSNAPALTGVKPLYSYPSYKNGKENEQHEGHKSFVLDVGQYYLTYQVHSDLATQNRFFVRFHSGGFYVTNKRSRELLARVIQKVDFGTIQANVGGYEDNDGKQFNSKREYVRPSEATRVTSNMQGTADRNIRVNIINGNVRSKLDPKYTYHLGNLVMVGLYEEWRGVMQCTNSNNTRHRFVLDVRDPSTALKSATAVRSDPPTYLYSPVNRLGHDDVIAMYSRHTSINRRLLMQYVTISDKMCPHGGKSDTGVWYTDPKGYVAYDAPGPNRMFQYMKPGFSLTLADSDFARYEVSNTWTGLFTAGDKRGTFYDPGSGLNYLVN